VIYQAPVYQAPPTVVYQAPQVVYAPAPAAVVYPQPATVIYQQPAPATVVYTSPRPVIVEPAYSPSVVLGRAAIDAAGRIASAAILNSHSHPYYVGRESERVRRW
jgi:hypothetical protein